MNQRLKSIIWKLLSLTKYNTMLNHYQTLELKSGASENEIKNAYRRLAKKYHPDVSKEPNAEARFIEITAAYEYLLKGGNDHSYTDYESSFDDYFDEYDPAWEYRQRAEDYARMNYEKFKQNNEAFKKSWYYELVKNGILVMVGLGYLLAAGLLLSPIIVYFMTKNYIAAGLMIFAAAISSNVYKFSKDLYKESRPYFADY